jgi:hypothetical protein
MKTNFVNQQEMVVLISRLGEAGVRKLVHELGTDVSNKLDAYLLAPKGAAQDTAELVWRVADAGEVALHEALIAREDEIWAATSCAPLFASNDVKPPLAAVRKQVETFH